MNSEEATEHMDTKNSSGDVSQWVWAAMYGVIGTSTGVIALGFSEEFGAHSGWIFSQIEAILFGFAAFMFLAGGVCLASAVALSFREGFRYAK